MRGWVAVSRRKFCFQLFFATLHHTMHRALRIDKVLRITFGTLVFSRTDLYHLSITCRTFLEPALDLTFGYQPTSSRSEVYLGADPEYTGQGPVLKLRIHWLRLRGG